MHFVEPLALQGSENGMCTNYTKCNPKQFIACTRNTNYDFRKKWTMNSFLYCSQNVLFSESHTFFYTVHKHGYNRSCAFQVRL